MKNYDEIETVEREREVFELRRAGHTFDAIAKQVDYATASGAYRAFQRALRRTLSDAGTEEYRALEIDRLDALQLAHWDNALAGDTKAGTFILRLMERRAKLLGLDALPQETPMGYQGGSDIDAEVQRLADLLALNSDTSTPLEP